MRAPFRFTFYYGVGVTSGTGVTTGVGATKSAAASAAVSGMPFMIQRMNTSMMFGFNERFGGMLAHAVENLFDLADVLLRHADFSFS